MVKSWVRIADLARFVVVRSRLRASRASTISQKFRREARHATVDLV